MLLSITGIPFKVKISFVSHLHSFALFTWNLGVIANNCCPDQCLKAFAPLFNKYGTSIGLMLKPLIQWFAAFLLLQLFNTVPRVVMTQP